MEQSLDVLEQYDLDIKGVRKGRGYWIIDSKEGEFVLKEYKGSKERLWLQEKLTSQIKRETGVLVQEIVANKEGELSCESSDERVYVLQTYMDGKECSLKEEKECVLAVQNMASMHKGMFLDVSDIEKTSLYSLQKEFTKRNTELRRIRRYLKEKRQKNEFERFLHSNFNYFFENALEVEEEWKEYEKLCVPKQDNGMVVFCHGDYQHHNVWMSYGEIMILQFEKFMADLPCRDLYLFMRKLLEKNNWDIEVGREMLEVYERERKLPYIEYISMNYRFRYPEKFWKIANFYFNSKKNFMPEKNMEKLEKVLEQEKNKTEFIDKMLRKIV